MRNRHPTSSFGNLFRRARGFSIISAIFIIVVLSALAAAIVTVSTSQQTGAAVDLSGTRAYLAARAGMEWGLYQVNTSYNYGYGGASSNTRSCPNGSGTPNSFAMPAATTLAGFTVTVTCTMLTDGKGGNNVYEVDAIACNVPATGWTATTKAACPGTLGTNYVERYVRVFM